MVVFTFSIFDRNYPSWANLVQKIKFINLSWNLVPRVIRICTIQRWCWLFMFSTKNTLFGQIWSKKKNCQFKLKPRLIRIFIIQLWCSFFVAFDRKDFWGGKFVPKMFKIVCWIWNLEPRLFRICRIQSLFSIFHFLNQKYYFSFN